MALLAGFVWAFVMFLIAQDAFKNIPEKIGPLILFSAVVAGWFAHSQTLLPFAISGVLLGASFIFILMLAIRHKDIPSK